MKKKGLKDLGSNPIINKSLTNIFAARVSFVLLDNKTNPKIFNDFGGWGSIGSLFFSKIDEYNPNTDFSTDSMARPLFPNNKNYPLENEIIYILPLPNNRIQSAIQDVFYYYFNPINIWNSVHHNAIPNPKTFQDITQQRDYEQTSIGASRKVKDGSTEIPLGDTFEEKLNVRNLQLFEGDITYEGRWGQSIRFGSTINNSKTFNPWSTFGENGNPIILIRNGQYNDNIDPWIPQIEDINKDKSSIYITSNQVIPIDVSSKNYNSYTEKPISSKEYKDGQVIITSERLLFNAKSDSILLSGNKSINLNSNKSINLDTKDFILNAEKILLGDKGATEPVILGDVFMKDFKKLLQKIIDLSDAIIKAPVGTPQPGIPHPTIPVIAPQLMQVAINMLNKIDKYKSKVSKSK